MNVNEKWVEDMLPQVEADLTGGFQYAIYLNNRKTGEVEYFEDAFLPGMMDARILALMWDQVAYYLLNICQNCPLGPHCHVLAKNNNKDYGAWKLCLVLFHDAFNPSWRLEDVV